MFSDIALVVATVGLLVATGVLAYFTYGLREEARASRADAGRGRLLSVEPRLTFDPHALGGKVGVLLIRNLGLGPALDVQLTITYEGPDVERKWGEPSIAPGESHELRFPQPFLSDIGEVDKQRLEVQVAGTMSDLHGRSLDVAEHVDVTHWWRTVADAEERVRGRRKLPGVSHEAE